jgi:hypothetical protein
MRSRLSPAGRRERDEVTASAGMRRGEGCCVAASRIAVAAEGSCADGCCKG